MKQILLSVYMNNKDPVFKQKFFKYAFSEVTKFSHIQGVSYKNLRLGTSVQLKSCTR